MAAARSGSSMTAAVVVAAALVVTPVLVAAPSAQAMNPGGSRGDKTHEDGKAGSKSKRHRSDSKVRDHAYWKQEPGNPSPAEVVLREGGLGAGQEQAVVKAIATNPARPELGELPSSLADKNDVIAEMFDGGPGSTATVGALVTESAGRPYAGQSVAHKLTLLTSGDGDTVAVTDVDDGHVYTFRRGQSVHVPGWGEIHGEVRAHVEPARIDHLTLTRLYPQAFIDEARVGWLGRPTRVLARDRQIQGYAEQALDAFAQNGMTDAELGQAFPGRAFEPTTVDLLAARLRSQRNGAHGILRITGKNGEGAPDYATVIIHNGRLLMYGTYNTHALGKRVSSPSHVPVDVSELEGQDIQFLSTQGLARIRPRPSYSLDTLPQSRYDREWHPVTHGEAATQILDIRPGQEVGISGTLLADAPSDGPYHPRSDSRVYAPQGTRVTWYLERKTARPYLEGMVRWNKGPRRDVPVEIPLDQAKEAILTYPLASTFISRSE